MSEAELITRHKGRKRALRAVSVTLVATLLFSFTVYLSSPDLRGWLAGLFTRPAPYGTAGPAHLEHGAPWGTLTIDGKRVDAATIEMRFAPLDLAPGAHRLVYTAALFPALECVISAEAQASDTCPLIRNPDAFERNVILAGPGRIIDLGAIPARLRQPDQESLTTVIDLSLYLSSLATETVAVGERYRIGADTVATATTALTAQLHYDLNRDPQRALAPAQAASFCVTICAGERLSGGDGAPAWGIGVHAVARWSYSSEEGVSAMAAPASKAAIPDEVIPLLVRWQGFDFWRISLWDTLGRAPICSIALRQLQDAGVQFAPNLNIQVATAKNPARGCLIAGLSPSPGAVALRFLYRFGVILTLDDATRNHAPTLPEATPAEQAIAAEIERGAGTASASAA